MFIALVALGLKGSKTVIQGIFFSKTGTEYVFSLP